MGLTDLLKTLDTIGTPLQEAGRRTTSDYMQGIQIKMLQNKQQTQAIQKRLKDLQQVRANEFDQTVKLFPNMSTQQKAQATERLGKLSNLNLSGNKWELMDDLVKRVNKMGGKDYTDQDRLQVWNAGLTEIGDSPELELTTERLEAGAKRERAEDIAGGLDLKQGLTKEAAALQIEETGRSTSVLQEEAKPAPGAGPAKIFKTKQAYTKAIGFILPEADLTTRAGLFDEVSGRVIPAKLRDAAKGDKELLAKWDAMERIIERDIDKHAGGSTAAQEAWDIVRDAKIALDGNLYRPLPNGDWERVD